MPIIRHGYSTRTQADYGYQHRKARQAWNTLVQDGCVRCARCNEPIVPGTPWDLDHTPDRSAYLGPSHARCNRVWGGMGVARNPTRP